jgi:transposase
LDKTLYSSLPRGLLGTALGYLNKNWGKLIRNTEDGGVNIDNNLAASAAIYSLIETAKANGLEPYAYLREVFARLPCASSDEELQALLPWNVSLV